jgi:hypothetical protein
MPPKHPYDERGSELFERITRLLGRVPQDAGVLDAMRDAEGVTPLWRPTTPDRRGPRCGCARERRR